MGTDRGRMVVALDDDTHERWRTLARENGVTLSAIQAERFDRRHVGPA